MLALRDEGREPSTAQETACSSSNVAPTSLPERPGWDDGPDKDGRKEERKLSSNGDSKSGGVLQLAKIFGGTGATKIKQVRSTNTQMKKCFYSKTGRCYIHHCKWRWVDTKEAIVRVDEMGKLSVGERIIQQKVCDSMQAKMGDLPQIPAQGARAKWEVGRGWKHGQKVRVNQLPFTDMAWIGSMGQAKIVC